MPQRALSATSRALAIGAVWLLGGAGSALGEPAQERAPDWFPAGDEARFPRAAFVVGLGSCAAEVALEARRGCAVSRAREELVLSIRAQVTATRTRESTLSASQDAHGEVATSTQQSRSAGTATGSLELENIAPQEVACTSQACFALVALSRTDYATRVLRRYDALNAQLSPLISREQSAQQVLPAFRALAKAQVLAQSMDALADAIAAVAGPATAPALASSAVSTCRREWLGSVHVCLEATGADLSAPVLLSHAIAALTALGFADGEIARAGGCAKAPVAVLVRAGFEPAREAGALTALDLQGELSVVVDGRLVGAATPIIAHALAPDLSRARAQAQEQFATRAKETLLRAFSGD
jgi:hypothetical protein